MTITAQRAYEIADTGTTLEDEFMALK